MAQVAAGSLKQHFTTTTTTTLINMMIPSAAAAVLSLNGSVFSVHRRHER